MRLKSVNITKGTYPKPNHVHLVAVPKEKDSLNRAIGEAHRRYTRMISFRE